MENDFVSPRSSPAPRALSRGSTSRLLSLLVALLLGACVLGGCSMRLFCFWPFCSTEGKGASRGSQRPYTVRGQTYYPLSSANGFAEEGLASWYGDAFHGKPTASGEPYNMYDMTGAHKLLPLGTTVRVTNLETGRSVELRINDRGPFVRGRILDASRRAAERLGLIADGTAMVRVEALSGVPDYRDGDFSGQFYVQIGSFIRPENAEALLRESRSKGYGASRIQEAMVGGQRFWRVQAGVFSRLNEARQAQERLERDYPSCFVIAD